MELLDLRQQGVDASASFARVVIRIKVDHLHTQVSALDAKDQFSPKMRRPIKINFQPGAPTHVLNAAGDVEPIKAKWWSYSTCRVQFDAERVLAVARNLFGLKRHAMRYSLEPHDAISRTCTVQLFAGLQPANSANLANSSMKINAVSLG
ncbi:hypothetical protein [Variovorax sp. KK3]|uniref:hypothetical protein n=1 Tax=Variovorax sp. KK3 TaxID=1855728 RepID=UPI00097BDB1E|nr:hypothetical protein [Variovorax sp. KK3]